MRLNIITNIESQLSLTTGDCGFESKQANKRKNKCPKDIFHEGPQKTFVREQQTLKSTDNGKESTINRALGGSTYPG